LRGHQNVRGSPKIKNKYLFASINTVKRKHVLEIVTFSIAHSHVLYFVKNVEKLVGVEVWTKGRDVPFRMVVKG
jgi:hypothetical protein